MSEQETPTITRSQAREALLRVEEVAKIANAALNTAPYGEAHRAIKSLDALHESVACELGLEILGTCEGCNALVCEGDDHIHTNDGCWLCTECRPSDADLERIRAIQAACPKGDPECSAQTEGDDHGFCWSAVERETVPTDTASATPDGGKDAT